METNAAKHKPGDFAPLFNTNHSYLFIFDDYRHTIMAETYMHNSQRAGEWVAFDAISADYNPEELLAEGIFEKVEGGFVLTDGAKQKIMEYEREKQLQTYDERMAFERELENSIERSKDISPNPMNDPFQTRIAEFYREKIIEK